MDEGFGKATSEVDVLLPKGEVLGSAEQVPVGEDTVEERAQREGVLQSSPSNRS